MRGSREDYITIAEYRKGLITRKEAAKKLYCVPEFFFEYINLLTEDPQGIESEQQEEMRRYGRIISGDDRCVDRDYTGRRCI